MMNLSQDSDRKSAASALRLGFLLAGLVFMPSAPTTAQSVGSVPPLAATRSSGTGAPKIGLPVAAGTGQAGSRQCPSEVPGCNPRLGD